MNIPVDLSNAGIPKPSIMKPSVHHETSTTSYTERSSSHKVHLNEHSVQPPEPLHQQRSSSSGYTKRSTHDVPVATRPVSAQPSDRTVNELRINVSSPYSPKPQEKVPIQLDSKIPQQRITRSVPNRSSEIYSETREKNFSSPFSVHQ